MNIYDKAAWQIDEGIDSKFVIQHFQNIMNWLKANDMLNANGIEILNIGIDDSFSLNSSLLNKHGQKFLDCYYDTIIEQSEYDPDMTTKLLQKYLVEYTKL